MRAVARAASPRAHREACVVGAGPAGLSAAVALARSRRFDRVVVVERLALPAAFDPTRGFVYSLDARGRAALDATVGLEDGSPVAAALAERAVMTAEELPITIAEPDGRVTDRSVAVKADGNVQYWMPRQDLLHALLGAAKTQEGVELRRGWEASVAIGDGGATVTLSPSGVGGIGSRAGVTLRPALLVGADGYRSRVKSALEAWDGSERFGLQSLPSPAAGLRYKVLTLPADLRLGDEARVAEKGRLVSIRGANKGSKKALRLGLLPVAPGMTVRTANVITNPDHELWTEVHDAESFYEYFQRVFPQVDWRMTVPEEEAASFAASSGGTFPEPQRTPCLGASLSEDGATAAVLVGDAAHAFPPDIGQGVNSALEDVELLAEQLDATSSGSGASLGDAVEAYSAARGPDVEALVRLVATSYPWQYSQSALGSFLWTLNFALRTVLNALLPKVFSPHSFILTQQMAGRPYTQIWRRAQETTKRVAALLAALACAAVAAAALALRGSGH